MVSYMDDEKLNKFLDNVISGASNEDLFKISQAAQPDQSRSPASQPSVTSSLSFNANQPQSQPSPMAPQKQKPISVEGDAYVPDLRLPYSKAKNPATEILLDNKNRINESRKASQAAVVEMGTKAAQELEQNKNSIAGIQKRIQGLENQKYVPDDELKKQIALASQSVSAEKVPDRDLMSEAILSFGPALFGSFLGESGQIAQLKAGQDSRKLYEGIRAENTKNATTRNDQALKRFKELLDLRRNQSDSFGKDQQLELDRLKAQLTGQIGVAGLTDKQIARADQSAEKIDSDRASDLNKAASEVGSLEDKVAEREAAEKRARIGAQGSALRAQRPTGAELKAAGALGMLRKSNADLAAIGGEDGSKFPSLKDPAFTFKVQTLSGKTPGSSLTENLIKDPKTRSQIQAETDWATTTLRDESGAAIGKDEAVNQLHRYFPRYGDGPEQIAQKAASRKQREAAIATEAGRAQAPAVVPTQKIAKPQAIVSPDKLKSMTYEQKLELARKKGFQK